MLFLSRRDLAVGARGGPLRGRLNLSSCCQLAVLRIAAVCWRGKSAALLKSWRQSQSVLASTAAAAVAVLSQ